MEKAAIIPKELFDELVDDVGELIGEWSWKEQEKRRGYDKQLRELRERHAQAVRYRDAIGTLRCDVCGRLHADDIQAAGESCECGRYKERMDWAKEGGE